MDELHSLARAIVAGKEKSSKRHRGSITLEQSYYSIQSLIVVFVLMSKDQDGLLGTG